MDLAKMRSMRTVILNSMDALLGLAVAIGVHHFDFHFRGLMNTFYGEIDHIGRSENISWIHGFVVGVQAFRQNGIHYLREHIPFNSERDRFGQLTIKVSLNYIRSRHVTASGGIKLKPNCPVPAS